MSALPQKQTCLASESALAPPPDAPGRIGAAQSQPVAVSRRPANSSANLKPKATKKDSQVTADPEAVCPGEDLGNVAYFFAS
jgi:hypothetical protein